MQPGCSDAGSSNVVATAAGRGRQSHRGRENLGNVGESHTRRIAFLHGRPGRCGSRRRPVDVRADGTLASTAAIAQAKVPHADTHVMTLPGKPDTRVR